MPRLLLALLLVGCPEGLHAQAEPPAMEEDETYAGAGIDGDQQSPLSMENRFGHARTGIRAKRLGELVADCPRIDHCRVTRCVPWRGQVVIYYEWIETLKGKVRRQTLAHVCRLDELREWARPGARAIVFSDGTSRCFCTGRGWFLVDSQQCVGYFPADGPDQIDLDADETELQLLPDSSRIFDGHIDDLREHIVNLLKSRSVTITAAAPGTFPTWEPMSDRATREPFFRPQHRLWRITADTRPGTAIRTDWSPKFVGWGLGNLDAARLFARIDAGDRRDRLEALDDLAGMESAALPLLPRIVPLLRDDDFDVRLAVAVIVQRIDPSNRVTLPVWREGLREMDPDRLQSTLHALSRLEANALIVLPSLMLARLQHTDSYILGGLAKALADVGIHADEPQRVQAVQLLLDMLRHVQRSHQERVVDALWRFGLTTRRAFPQALAIANTGNANDLLRLFQMHQHAGESYLLELTGSGNFSTADYAARCLAGMSSFAVAGWYRDRLWHPDHAVRWEAVRSLQGMKLIDHDAELKPVIEHLELYGSERMRMRFDYGLEPPMNRFGRLDHLPDVENINVVVEYPLYHVIRLMDRLKASGRHRAALLKFLRKPNDDAVISPVMKVFLQWHLDPPHQQGDLLIDRRVDHLRSLRAVLRDDKSDEHIDALWAIKSIGPDAAPLIPDIVPFLRSDKSPARALFALEAIGPASRAALPRMLEFIGSDDADLENLAMSAVSKIDPSNDRLRRRLLQLYSIQAIDLSRIEILIDRRTLRQPELLAAFERRYYQSVDEDASIRNFLQQSDPPAAKRIGFPAIGDQ